MAQTLPHKIPFTADAYAQMIEQLVALEKELIEVMARLKTAREMGDLSENGAYIYAKFELGKVRREINRLKHLIDNGEVVYKNADQSKVDFGNVVTLTTGKKEVVYTLVSLHESNPKESKLSIESPLGNAIMGKKVGDRVKIKTPGGEVQYTVMRIE